MSWLIFKILVGKSLPCLQNPNNTKKQDKVFTTK